MNEIINQLLPVTLVSPDAPGWEWNIIDKDSDDSGLYYGRVRSPLSPKGELGTIDVNDLNTHFNLTIG